MLSVGATSTPDMMPFVGNLFVRLIRSWWKNSELGGFQAEEGMWDINRGCWGSWGCREQGGGCKSVWTAVVLLLSCCSHPDGPALCSLPPGTSGQDVLGEDGQGSE